MKLCTPHLLTFFILLISSSIVIGQDDCTVKLKEAQKLFEEGKIEKIPDLIDNCIESGFNKENRISALQLLTQVYLFDDNMDKAEETLLKLLKIDPEYQINRNVDPIEFIRLYAMFHTESVFSIGFVAGANISTPRLLKTYTTNTFNEANPSYKHEGLGIALGAKLIYHYNNEFDVILEPKYSTQKYFISENTDEFSVFTGVESKSFFEIPVLASYYFYNYRQASFFADLGFSYSMLLTSEISDQVNTHDFNVTQDKKGSNIPTNNFSKNYLASGIIGIGGKYKMKRDNIQINIRYNFTFNNAIEESVRSNAQDYPNYNNLRDAYRFDVNDISLSSFSFLVSYNREFYIHRKKK